MAEKLKFDQEPHELKLGKSFESDRHVGFHSFRYDFKPASVDTTKSATVDIGNNNSVTVKVPHVEGSGTSHTVYKGNKRPCQKECVLIIDHKTGEITLEKLASTIQLKKTRLEVNKPQLGRPVTPVDRAKSSPSNPPAKKHSHTSSSKSHTHSPHTQERDSVVQRSPVSGGPSPLAEQVGEMSDSSSDSSSGSDDSSSSDSEAEENQNNTKAQSNGNSAPAAAAPPVASHGNSGRNFLSTLSEDLRLSESGSDSD